MALEEKLKRLAEQASEETVDWERRKAEWITAVNHLYDDVELWLEPWREKGYLTTTRTPIPKSERRLGIYAIDTLEIAAGDEAVVFEPFARYLVGIDGRVDVYLRGLKSDARLLVRLQDDEGEDRWELRHSKFVGSRLPFDKPCLEALLDELL